VLIRRYDHAATGTRVDVDVRVDAALADEPQRVEALEQRLTDVCTLANQHQRLGVFEALSQRIDVLGVIVPDRDLVAVQLAKARKSTKRVEVVVENRNLHTTCLRIIVRQLAAQRLRLTRGGDAMMPHLAQVLLTPRSGAAAGWAAPTSRFDRARVGPSHNPDLGGR
jgi:hypothetical protein